MDKNTNRINAATSAIERYLGEQPPIVCAYGCVPQWPEGLPKVNGFEAVPAPPAPKKEVDVEKIQEICAAIKAFKEKLRYLDDLTLGPGVCIFAGYSDGKDAVTLIAENHEEEISKGILELIRSHYENEIQRLTDELVREAGGSASVSI